MKRVLSVICVIVLALCLTVSAYAAEPVYELPGSLKTVAASADKLNLPEGLPEHAHVVSFTNDNGLINVKLDREVPSLKIKELNFIKGEESTIFSKANTASAEAHQAGNEYSIFNVLVTWKIDGQKYTEEFDTWSGYLVFDRAGLTEKAAAGTFPSWDTAERRVSFSEEGVLLSEVWTLEKSDQTLTRTANYGADGQLTSCRISWQSPEYNGKMMEIETAPDGTVTAVRCRSKACSFVAESLPLTAGWQKFANLRDNSYAPAAFEAAFRALYPRLAESIYGPVQEQPGLPATATDLPATATDLKKEPVPEGEPTENTRLWLIAYGDYFESTMYAFASDDPLFLIQGDIVVPNPDAKDINGTPVTYQEMDTTATPVFEAVTAE